MVLYRCFELITTGEFQSSRATRSLSRFLGRYWTLKNLFFQSEAQQDSELDTRSRSHHLNFHTTTIQRLTSLNPATYETMVALAEPTQLLRRATLLDAFVRIHLVGPRDLGCAIGWDAYCALGRSDMSWLLHLVYR
jgi:hypothetical protein